MDEHWGPLERLAVIEAGTMVSVPAAGRLLANFGATLTKVEHPDGGDHSRDFGPKRMGWEYGGSTSGETRSQPR